MLNSLLLLLLDRIISTALRHGLHLHLFLDHQETLFLVRLLELHSGHGGIICHGVLNRHDPVIDLRLIVLLDCGCSGFSLRVDESVGAQILSMNVQIEVGIDQDATFGEELLHIEGLVRGGVCEENLP